MIYCSVLSRKLVNRGFLAGPVCPVYGFGALLVIAVLEPVSTSILVVFLCGLLLTSILEYFTSWLLEIFFRTSWWNYENENFNINGRVCLKNSIFFGILSVVLMKVLYPFVAYVVSLIPDLWMQMTSIVLFVAFVMDSLFTVNTLISLNERLKKLHEFTEELKKTADIHEWFNEHEVFKSFEKLKLMAEEGRNELNSIIEESKAELNNIIREKYESLIGRRGSGLRILKAFPDMKSINYNTQLNNLKEGLKLIKQKANHK